MIGHLRGLPSTLLGTSLLLATVPQARAETYYVAPNGSDQETGSAERPWQTITVAVGRMAAGDTLVVNAGIYRESVVVTGSGTAAEPLTVRGLPGAVLESPDPDKSLSAFDLSAGAAYVRLQGFELRGGFDETVFVRDQAHDIELSGMNIHDNHTGIWVGGAYNVIIRDTVLQNNFRTGVRLFAGAHAVQIIDSRSEGNDDGEGCDGDSDGFNADGTCDEILFDNASAIGNSEDGFDLKATNVTLRRITSRGNQCSGLKLGGEAYVENALVEANRTAVNAAGPAGSRITLAFSTLIDNGAGVRALGAGYTLALNDSVISGPSKALEYGSGVTLIEARNVLFRPDLRERLIVQETAAGQLFFSGDHINAGGWSRASGQGVGTVASDPGLDGASWRPTAASPAVDEAGNDGAPPIDHDGNPRPSGAGYDRGAMERQVEAWGLGVYRARLRSEPAGWGRVWLQADLESPGVGDFRPQTDPLAVTLGGARGTIAHLEVAAGQLRASRRSPGVYRAAVRGTDGRSLRLTLRERAGGYDLSLYGRRVDAWCAPDGVLTLEVIAGPQRASTMSALRATAAHRFSLP